MKTVDLDSIADIDFQLTWQSARAVHTECYAARGVNLWRDGFPETLHHRLIGRRPLDRISVDFPAGALFDESDAPIDIDRRRCALPPETGRFYPKGRLSGLPGIFPQNMQPFRCVGVNNGHLTVDLAHPLARYALSIAATVGQVSAKASERGGSSIDWVGLLTDGPGMQARWQDRPTDFFNGRPFDRGDERADAEFYTRPRLVNHLDRTARDGVADIYRRFVGDGMHVLDLMSSWVSHLPASVQPAAVSGLGMNRMELERNPRLSDIRVHDVNADPHLPYPDAVFDTVICTVSVEYLTRPLALFGDVGRVLKPDGAFVVAFSDRWFPPKVVRIWERIHEFERMGLVLEYFIRSGVFDRLGTYSMRGLPRPHDDKYAGERPFSDPVYAVWGRRCGPATNP